MRGNTAVAFFLGTLGSQLAADEAFERDCQYDTVCLETAPCTARSLEISVVSSSEQSGGRIFTPGVTYDISWVNRSPQETVTVLGESDGQALMLLSIYTGGESRLTIHSDIIGPTTMTYFGTCR